MDTETKLILYGCRYREDQLAAFEHLATDEITVSHLMRRAADVFLSQPSIQRELKTPKPTPTRHFIDEINDETGV